MFAVLTRLRHKRALHPNGVGFTAELVTTPEPKPGQQRGDAAASAQLFARTGRHPAVVRFSRALGLPPHLPDVHGLALQVPDAYGPDADQDFLLVTSGRRPIARHLLLPTQGFARHWLSSVLAYRIGNEAVLVGAGPLLPLPAAAETGSLSAIAASPDWRGELRFELAVATLGGQWRSVGHLEVNERLAPEATEELAFNPWHSGGGIEPIGVLNALRDPAYRSSQGARKA